MLTSHQRSGAAPLNLTIRMPIAEAAASWPHLLAFEENLSLDSDDCLARMYPHPTEVKHPSISAGLRLAAAKLDLKWKGARLHSSPVAMQLHDLSAGPRTTKVGTIERHKRPTMAGSQWQLD